MSVYEQKLDAVCKTIEANPGSGGARALRAIAIDLKGNGQVGGLMFLDDALFDMARDHFQEFRRSGRHEAFNSIHSTARDRVRSV